MGSLHITNGDCVAGTLRLIVDDPVVIAADVLHEGPCPAVDGQAWHEVRAHFLAPHAETTRNAVKEALAAGDRAIVDAFARGDEIVLWFEHDLFDQLALIRTLDLIVRLTPQSTDISATRGIGATTKTGATNEIGASGATSAPVAPVVSGFSRTLPRVSLICIDRFPGVDRFIGLGQLTGDQLATLIGTGVPITADHGAIAAAAWNAFRSPDPTGLMEMATRLTPDTTPNRSMHRRVLPFLREALLRFLAEFPSAGNGLSRTEAFALTALLAGPTTAGALFAATQANEAAPFMGDLTFFEILRRLASCRVPLVAVDAGPDEPDLRPHRIAITHTGREVIAGRADHVRLNGIDLWRGGVHLAGSDRSPWRWDARGETLIS